MPQPERIEIVLRPQMEARLPGGTRLSFAGQNALVLDALAMVDRGEVMSVIAIRGMRIGPVQGGE